MMSFNEGAYLGGGTALVFMGIFLIIILFSLAYYVYISFAFMALGKKAKLKNPRLAWIPAFGPAIIAFQTSRMHWWPWLMFLSLLLFWIPFVGMAIYYIAMMILTVFSIIWHWKMFEKIKRPGWWALLCLIPFVNLVLFGIAAWGKK